MVKTKHSGVTQTYFKIKSRQQIFVIAINFTIKLRQINLSKISETVGIFA